MTDPQWQPFGLTDDETEIRRVLVAGVPTWMRSSLLGWIRALIADGNYVSAGTIESIEQNCLLSLGLDPASRIVTLPTAMSWINNLADGQLLRVADYLVSLQQWRSYSPSRDSLAAILDNSSSMWMLGTRDGKPGLVSRVPEGVQDAAEAVMREGTAGQVLAKAWGKVHALDADDSGAYAAAVKAVEIASFHALGVDKKDATLGDSIRALENDDAWRLPFLREHHKSPSHDVLLGMLRTLWRGHRDRHGTADYKDVTHEEADAAVTMAVTLVRWFMSGVVQRRSTEDFA